MGGGGLSIRILHMLPGRSYPGIQCWGCLLRLKCSTCSAMREAEKFSLSLCCLFLFFSLPFAQHGGGAEIAELLECRFRAP